MQISKINAREIEELLKKNYGSKLSLKNFDVFLNEDQKVYISVKGLPQSFIEKSSYMFYFGTLKRNNKILLSIDASQMVGKTAVKNIAIVDEENALKFIEGLNASPKKLVDCEIGNFVLIKFKEDFLGSGVLRENYIENYVPKYRKILMSIKKV
ncbi:MAG: hypothetical protein N3A69_16465 [Leptospiraceae bacterium]|nr:hypothetical protein [Leptospiraceae bacterium]